MFIFLMFSVGVRKVNALYRNPLFLISEITRMIQVMMKSARPVRPQCLPWVPEQESRPQWSSGNVHVRRRKGCIHCWLCLRDRYGPHVNGKYRRQGQARIHSLLCLDARDLCCGHYRCRELRRSSDSCGLERVHSLDGRVGGEVTLLIYDHRFCTLH